MLSIVVTEILLRFAFDWIAAGKERKTMSDNQEQVQQQEPRELERCCCIHFYNALRRKLIVLDKVKQMITIPIQDRGELFQQFETAYSPWSSKELYIRGCPWCGADLDRLIYWRNPNDRLRWER